MLCLTKIRTSSRRSARFYKCVSKTRFGLDGICNFHVLKNTLRRGEVERGCPFWERAFCRGETFQNQEKDCFEQCLGGGGRHFISRSSPFAISLSLEFKENRHALCCWQPYRVECTGSLPTSEVEQHRARLVLGWGTAWEDLRVLSALTPTHSCFVRQEGVFKKRKKKKLAAPQGVPRRSPTLVLTGPCAA